MWFIAVCVHLGYVGICKKPTAVQSLHAMSLLPVDGLIVVYEPMSKAYRASRGCAITDAWDATIVIEECIKQEAMMPDGD